MQVTDKEAGRRYTFSIMGPSGSERKHGLVRSFIQERTINFAAVSVDCEGLIWELYVEPRLKQQFLGAEDVKCVVSFQAFADGERIAVARQWMRRDRIQKRKHTATGVL